MKVKIKKLDKKAIIPRYAHSGDAGLDLVATWKSYESETVSYGTGLAIEIPKGYVGLIFPRSSIYKYDLSLANSVGVIDSGYKGEIKCIFNLNSSGNYTYNMGDRIAQLIIIPYPEIEFEEVPNLGTSDRGENGFGSTGK